MRKPSSTRTAPSVAAGEAPKFQVNAPDWEKARTLALQAVHQAEAGKFAEAVALLEQAIRLDAVAGLNQFHSMRAEYCSRLGNAAPQKALELYTYGIKLTHAGRFRDLELAYREAARLDPVFAWPLNNLAWMLATSKDRSICDGPRAVALAQEACARSDWSCWAFIGTLAAAHAAAGDFASAIGWQRANLPLVPPAHRLDAELELRHYELGNYYVDEGQEPAGSSEPDEPDESLIHTDKLTLGGLRRLFHAGYLETHVDNEGDLWVLDRIRILVKPMPGNRSIALACWQSVADEASAEDCLRFVNRVNHSLRLVRACFVDDEGRRSILVDHEISAHGGITRKTLILTVRLFADILSHAIRELDSEGVLSGNRS